MIYFLTKEHFESMRIQMEHEEDGKILLKSIPKLTDILMNKSTTSISKNTHDFKSYLPIHYRVEGSPLDYVVQLKLTHLPWYMMNP